MIDEASYQMLVIMIYSATFSGYSYPIILANCSLIKILNKVKFKYLQCHNITLFRQQTVQISFDRLKNEGEFQYVEEFEVSMLAGYSKLPGPNQFDFTLKRLTSQASGIILYPTSFYLKCSHISVVCIL